MLDLERHSSIVESNAGTLIASSPANCIELDCFLHDSLSNIPIDEFKEKLSRASHNRLSSEFDARNPVREKVVKQVASHGSKIRHWLFRRQDFAGEDSIRVEEPERSFESLQDDRSG